MQRFSDNPKVAKRQKVERSIVRRVVLDAIKLGYFMNINNGGDTLELEENSNKSKVILEGLFATDDETLIFYKDGKKVGGVYFVYGNAGWEVINDNTDNEQVNAILKGAEALAERYEERNQG